MIAEDSVAEESPWGGRYTRRDAIKLAGLGVTSAALAGLGIVSTTAPAHAKVGAFLTPWNQTGVPRSFKQNNAEGESAEGVPDYTSMNITSGGSVNLGKQGCAIFALLNMYLKSQSRGTNYSVMDFREENQNAVNGGSSAVTTAGGLLSWGTAGSISKSDKSKGYFKYVKEKNLGGGVAYDQIKSFEDEGYMMVIGVMGSNGTYTGHWIAVDYVDTEKKKVAVLDSGWGSEWLEDSQFNGRTGPIKCYQAYDMDDNKVAAKDLPRISEWAEPGKGGSGGSGDDNSSGGEGSDKPAEKYEILSEEDLTGMESYKDQKELYDTLNVQSSDIGDAPALTDEELMALEDLRRNIEAQKSSPTDIANQGIAFVGMAGMMYSVLLFFGYLFDVTNNFFEGSVVRTMTAGKLSPVYDKEDTGKREGVTHINMGGALKYMLIGTLFSLVLVSGVIFGWIEVVFNFITEHNPL